MIPQRTSFDRFNCPAQHAVMQIGDRWTLFIVREFVFGEHKQGFNQLLRALKPISSRTLALKLQKLQDHGILDKKVIREKPPKVEYTMTPKGSALKKPLQDLADWHKRYNAVNTALR